MAALKVDDIAGLLKLFELVRVVRLEQAIPGAAVIESYCDDHGLLDKGAERPEDAARFGSRANCLRRIECESALEYGQALEQCRLVGGQEPMAPIDGGGHRLLALRRTPCSRSEDAKTIVAVDEQPAPGHEAEPGRCHLDRQWTPVEPLADRDHRLAV